MKRLIFIMGIALFVFSGCTTSRLCRTEKIADNIKTDLALACRDLVSFLGLDKPSLLQRQ